MAKRFPKDKLAECKCEESRTILFGLDSRLEGRVGNPGLSRPRDAPLYGRYGGTYSSIERSQQPFSAQRTRFPSSVKHELFEKCRGVCAGCLDNFRQPGNMEIDHIVPLHKGGTNDPHNLQLLCRSCNTQKGTGTMDELILKLKRAGIR